ncbi:MAG TPA: hypothetical protein VK138_14380 [Acidiferrobacterales bacterium]|nr:hypothetical protein [Acidiferrobacterales bacterium]
MSSRTLDAHAYEVVCGEGVLMLEGLGLLEAGVLGPVRIRYKTEFSIVSKHLVANVSERTFILGETRVPAWFTSRSWYRFPRKSVQ